LCIFPHPCQCCILCNPIYKILFQHVIDIQSMHDILHLLYV
jgi:hypothetical protein